MAADYMSEDFLQEFFKQDYPNSLNFASTPQYMQNNTPILGYGGTGTQGGLDFNFQNIAEHQKNSFSGLNPVESIPGQIGGQTADPGILSQLNDFFSGDAVKNIGGLATGAAGLYGAYTGHQEQKLAEELFDFQSGLATENFNKQVKLLNEERSDRSDSRFIWSGGAGNKDNRYLPKAEYAAVNDLKEFDKKKYS